MPIINIKIGDVEKKVYVNNDIYEKIFGEENIDDIFSVFDIDDDNENLTILNFNEMTDKNEYMKKLEIMKDIIIKLLPDPVFYKLLKMYIEKIANPKFPVSFEIEEISFTNNDYYFGKYMKKYGTIKKYKIDGFNGEISAFEINDDIDYIFKEFSNFSTFRTSALELILIRDGISYIKILECINKIIEKHGIDKIANEYYKIYNKKIKRNLSAKNKNKSFIEEFITKLYMDDELKYLYDEIIDCLNKKLSYEEKIKYIVYSIVATDDYGIFEFNKKKYIYYLS